MEKSREVRCESTWEWDTTTKQATLINFLVPLLAVNCRVHSICVGSNLRSLSLGRLRPEVGHVLYRVKIKLRLISKIELPDV